ncbi:predicted protein [Histoplasma capsulatum G186AR]|uniref:Uncharacterized protein n=1 Tax=Ajellomyces capsulatus (strain G186AR / H82 / ATCC MYA-2454 / RMSCC 2432) TaxID=447093 RepID=C0P088_AJECG|nr:uncharacterized protein HCBG_08807 [Histoplasma capsulatum G186AR]EEH02904.1 predicted protein [Histoplasma capsulatum G186AR]
MDEFTDGRPDEIPSSNSFCPTALLVIKLSGIGFQYVLNAAPTGLTKAIPTYGRVGGLVWIIRPGFIPVKRYDIQHFSHKCKPSMRSSFFSLLHLILSFVIATVAVGAEYQVQTNKDDYDNGNGRKSDLMLMEDIPLPMDPREFSHVGGESVLRSLKSEFEVMDQDPYSSDLLAAAVEASSLSPDAEKGELRHVDLVQSQHLPRVASPKPPPGWLDYESIVIH